MAEMTGLINIVLNKLVSHTTELSTISLLEMYVMLCYIIERDIYFAIVEGVNFHLPQL